MGEVELPELPELEKEKRKDKLNTLVAITVTFLVAFMAICKIQDNNIVLNMERLQADKVDSWAWFQSLNVREDITLSKISDLKDDLGDEDATHQKVTSEKITAYEALAKKIADKKEAIKQKAEEQGEAYERLNVTHEKFDHTEGAISIAVSLLALTSLLQKHWLYAVALGPAICGIYTGIWGLMG